MATFGGTPRSKADQASNYNTKQPMAAYSHSRETATCKLATLTIYTATSINSLIQSTTVTNGARSMPTSLPDIVDCIMGWRLSSVSKLSSARCVVTVNIIRGVHNPLQLYYTVWASLRNDNTFVSA